MSSGEDFIVNAQNLRLRDKFRILRPLDNLGRGIAEGLFTKYKDRMDLVRALDGELRQVALGQSSRNLVNLGLRDALKLAHKSFDEARYIDATYYVAIINDTLSLVLQEGNESVKNLRELGLGHFSETENDESLEYFDGKEYGTDEDGDVSNADTGWGSIPRALYRFIAGDPLEKAYAKEILKRKKAMEAMLKTADAAVTRVLGVYDKMGMALAQGKIDNWLAAYDELTKSQGALQSKFTDTYNNYVKELIEIAKKVNKTESLGDKKSYQFLSQTFNFSEPTGDNEEEQAQPEPEPEVRPQPAAEEEPFDLNRQRNRLLPPHEEAKPEPSKTQPMAEAPEEITEDHPTSSSGLDAPTKFNFEPGKPPPPEPQGVDQAERNRYWTEYEKWEKEEKERKKQDKPSVPKAPEPHEVAPEDPAPEDPAPNKTKSEEAYELLKNNDYTIATLAKALKINRKMSLKILRDLKEARLIKQKTTNTGEAQALWGVVPEAKPEVKKDPPKAAPKPAEPEAPKPADKPVETSNPEEKRPALDPVVSPSEGRFEVGGYDGYQDKDNKYFDRTGLSVPEWLIPKQKNAPRPRVEEPESKAEEPETKAEESEPETETKTPNRKRTPNSKRPMVLVNVGDLKQHQRDTGFIDRLKAAYKKKNPKAPKDFALHPIGSGQMEELVAKYKSSKNYYDDVTLEDLEPHMEKPTRGRRKRSQVEEAMLKVSHNKFFNSLKLASEQNDLGAMVRMLVAYSDKMEDKDPELSLKLLGKAQEIING